MKERVRPWYRLLLLLQDHCPMALTARTEFSKIALRPSPSPSRSRSSRQWVERMEMRGKGESEPEVFRAWPCTLGHCRVSAGSRARGLRATGPSCSSKPVPGLDQDPSFHLLCRIGCKLSLTGDMREMSVSQTLSDCPLSSFPSQHLCWGANAYAIPRGGGTGPATASNKFC